METWFQVSLKSRTAAWASRLGAKKIQDLHLHQWVLLAWTSCGFKDNGEFCLLLPGQENVVLTKEIIGLRSTTELFDQFYLMWVMNLPIVRKRWNRVVFMQTNREDVGKRYLEIKIPVPTSKDVATSISAPYTKYFHELKRIRTELHASITELSEKYSFKDEAIK